MFDNIGGKIKGLAKVICWIGIIISVIVGIILLANSTIDYGKGIFGGKQTDPLMVAAGLGVMIVGSLFSWLGSFVLYGFGQLVENSSSIRFDLSQMKGKMDKFAKEGASYSSQSSSTSNSANDWLCGYCNTRNPQSYTTCKLCGKPRLEQDKRWM